MIRKISEKVECPNCGLLDSREVKVRYPDIPDLFERIDSGEPVPFGECPHCGFLVHEVTKESTLRDAAPELLDALEESLKEMDAFQAYWTSPNMGLKRGSCIAQEKARAAIAKAKGEV